MVKIIAIQIDQGDEGCRLDRWFKRHYSHWPFTVVARLVRTGQARLDHKRTKLDARVITGQLLRFPEFDLPLPVAHSINPHAAKLADILRSNIIHINEDIIVLNKPIGVAVQGGTKVTVSIDDAAQLLVGPEDTKPKIVHRLDRDTSGLLLLARSGKVAAMLASMFQHRKVEKSYLAIWSGVPKAKQGTINKSLRKTMRGNFESMQVCDVEEQMVTAITDYKVLDYALDQASLVRLSPRTGRMHQLRAHSKDLGYPIIGDHKYRLSGKPRPNDVVDQLHLLAHELRFSLNGRDYHFTAPLPQFFTESMKHFGLVL